MKWYIPSAFSFSRLILTPVVMWLILTARWKWAALVFVAAAITDGLDGASARLFGVMSKFGLYLDTTADKVLISCTLLALAFSQRISTWAVWAVAVILAREILVLGLKAQIAVGRTVQPSWSGKIKMGIECVAITFVILHPWESGWFSLPWSDWMLVGAALAGLQSGTGYLLRYRHRIIGPAEEAYASEEHRWAA
ncbi:MAG: CDP-alcohol phosphatidyltransferase family protein [Candidatus Colwellbacteria bacterium]|nr:CDP-alcohol phosphatidyltransferase family protein [Candidatus Colwellbacteria bacterium]